MASFAVKQMDAFPSFRPHPLVRGGHLQTILGCYFFHRAPPYAAEQFRVMLDDGDQLVVHDDCPASWQQNDPVALLVHGLGGSHESGYMQRCAQKLNARGVRAFRMDLRGCGAGIGLARHVCHAGRSADVAAVLADVTVRCPNSPVAVIGFSMGANMVLKLAGEWGDQVPDNAVGVLAVAPPVDLDACCTSVEKSLRGVYDRSFVSGLRRHLVARQRNQPHLVTPPLAASSRGIREFDARFTAPLSGFADVDDYYAQASSGPHLSKIQVPTLIIAAADDPIVPIACVQQAHLSGAVKLIVAASGGHLGFVGARSADPDCRWLDWRVVDWTLGRMAAAPTLATSHSS
jgi:predicted alpha/beta-fold hydrolase